MKEIFLRKSALIQKSFNREMDYWEFHGKTCFTMQFDQKNSHLDCSSTHNYESSNYTQGNGWSSFYHSGSFGSGYFYNDYDFTADWSESFNGVTNSYSSAHSASNNVEGDNYSLSGYFSDYYKTWDGQSPDSGGYSDSYPSSSPYASTVTDNGFSFTWSGHDIMSRQGVYLHNAPYSGMWEIPYGLGSYSNPVEQPNSAWPTDPETPESYTTPSQSYVDDLDAFFYGYDNTDLYETGLQEYGEITVTNASGSASYSSEVFYENFFDNTLWNQGTGSELTDTEKDSVADGVSETISELDELLAGVSTWSANTSGVRSQTENRGWWSPFRWLWTGDGYAADEVLEAALTAGGNSYFENVPAVHGTLERGSILDPTGLMDATDQVLYDIEEGKSLTEAGGNAILTLTDDRIVAQAAGQLPTPGGDPADNVGFARKAKNGTSDSAKPTNIPHAGNVRKLSDKEWKRYGIDPHVLKKEILGRKSPISHYDIAMDTSQKTADGYEIIIISHRTATEFSYIPTGVFIKKD